MCNIFITLKRYTLKSRKSGPRGSQYLIFKNNLEIMVNPYASEDFNRIRVNPRDRKAEGDVQSVPHPLMEGKKLDISPNELKAFTKAMEQ